jgi:hypothetical protein
VKKLVQELQAIGFRTRNHDLSAKRLIALKFGLRGIGIKSMDSIAHTSIYSLSSSSAVSD